MSISTEPRFAEGRAGPGVLDWIADTARVCVGVDAAASMTGTQLKQEARVLADRLRQHFVPRSVVGTLADNSAAWLIADLALQSAGMVHVPLPMFFSAEQMLHAVRSSSMAGLFCADAGQAAALGYRTAVMDAHVPAHPGLKCFTPDGGVVPCARTLPRNVSKITFTSGTTGAPKGVMLSNAQQLSTARGIAAVTAGLCVRRHLCMLPLPVLLENVAGVYTALMTGMSCVLRPLEAVGLNGASGFDPGRCVQAVASSGAESIILLPEMLHALVTSIQAAQVRPASFAKIKYVAVGGARTPPALIQRARALGLPVYEGYGLSECASVVALNLPAADRVGSVGRPLPGLAVRINGEGEIEVHGRGFEGYLGGDAPAMQAWLATGDLGVIDDAGYLSIAGRKDSLIVTGFGRNVSPEWPEGLLAGNDGILQAAVFGAGRPFLAAVIVASPEVDDAEIAARVAAVNTRLPEYARIEAWTRASEGFTVANGLATANGRMRRSAIYARYRASITALYDRAARRYGPEPAPAAR